MNKVVLIVDDEPANIDLIKGLMPDYCKCKAAINGQLAIKQIQKNTPDLVILDLVMPGKDGVAVLAEIRQNPELSSLPVLIVSGDKDPVQQNTLNDLGISGYITKPIDSQEILSHIHYIFMGN